MSPVWHLGAQAEPEPASWAFHATWPDAPPPAPLPAPVPKPGPKPEKFKRLVETIHDQPGLTCVQIAAATGLPIANTNNLLIALRGRGLVTSWGPIPRRWSVGPVDKLAAAGMLPPKAARGGSGTQPCPSSSTSTPRSASPTA